MNNQFFTLQKVSLNGYDLDKSNIKLITIFNNIDGIGISINLTYNDVTDIKNKLPLRGGEEVDIILLDSNKVKFNKTFVLTDIITSTETKNEYINIVQFKLITKESFYFSINRVYTSITNTVTKAINQITGINSNTSTKEVNQYIIPGWTKTKAIQYLTSFTKDHICFENNSGFVLESLSSLLVPSNKVFKFSSNNTLHADLVLDYREIKVIDVVNEGYNNIYKRDYITYNPGTKSINNVYKDIESEQGNLNTLGRGKNYSQDVLDNISTMKVKLPFYNGNLTNKNISNEMFGIKYELVVRGDLSLDIGKTINLNVKDKFNNNVNPNTNGLYIITKISHNFTAKDFYTKLHIEKNSYFKGISKEDNITDNVVI